jgi:hypothetical protein
MRYLFILTLLSFSFAPSELPIDIDIDKMNSIIDNWHLAATDANFAGYFDLMSDKFTFLGTAPGERWSKEEFSAFSKPYFEKGKTWDFKAIDRSWVFLKNKKMAWFDENLNTWMSDCRGSGIMIFEKGEWKLAYYNLTVLIENEKIEDFIRLRER